MMTTQKSGRDDAVGGLDRLPKAVGQSVASPIPRLCLWRPSQASKAMAIDASRVSRDKKKKRGDPEGASHRRQLTGGNLARPVKQTDADAEYSSLFPPDHPTTSLSGYVSNLSLSTALSLFIGLAAPLVGY